MAKTVYTAPPPPIATHFRFRFSPSTCQTWLDRNKVNSLQQVYGEQTTHSDNNYSKHCNPLRAEIYTLKQSVHFATIIDCHSIYLHIFHTYTYIYTLSFFVLTKLRQKIWCMEGMFFFFVFLVRQRHLYPPNKPKTPCVEHVHTLPSPQEDWSILWSHSAAEFGASTKLALMTKEVLVGCH